ncbi:MAG: BCCT family transporter [Dehalococcoidia bacterium]|nr:BCCT family transporter [Dehalococcoidia bacterium]
MLGDRIYGPWGHLVDVFALFGTMFGVATSLGLGAMQVNSGLNAFLGIEETRIVVQTLIIAAITAAATVSVVLGLDAGIRRLSLFNIGAATLLLVFVLLAGPTLFVIDFLFQVTGEYAQNLVSMSLWTGAVRDSDWQAQWTWFYWGWWIAWSPFVGMFIARISRGRTIREFITGVMLVPTGVTFAWLAIMGGTALHQEMAGNPGIAEAVAGGDESTAVFVMLEGLPLADITAALTVVVVAAFFVTSSDSGSFVIDMLASGGDPNPPRTTRCLLGAASKDWWRPSCSWRVASPPCGPRPSPPGLPIALIMVVVCYSLVKALRTEPIHIAAREGEPPPPDDPYGTRESRRGGVRGL